MVTLRWCQRQVSLLAPANRVNVWTAGITPAYLNKQQHPALSYNRNFGFYNRNCRGRNDMSDYKRATMQLEISYEYVRVRVCSITGRFQRCLTSTELSSFSVKCFGFITPFTISVKSLPLFPAAAGSCFQLTDQNNVRYMRRNCRRQTQLVTKKVSDTALRSGLRPNQS